jgi:hypothetical protein
LNIKAITGKTFIKQKNETVIAYKQKISENNEKDARLQAIYLKYQAGKKLTAYELRYIASKAPDTYSEAAEKMRRREVPEKAMKNAETKAEATAHYMNALNCETDGNPDEIMVNQYNDAYRNHINGNNGSTRITGGGKRRNTAYNERTAKQ